MTVDEALDAIRDIVIVAENDGYGITGPLGNALGDLIAVVQTEQYDAIKAAVMNAPVVIRLDTHAMYTTILDAIAKHDPRKGAE